MTRLDRVLNFIRAIAQIIFAVLIFLDPDDGLVLVIYIIGIDMILRALGNLTYYFTMARSMVGGRFALYRGIIYLDFGVFTVLTVDALTFYLIIYIAILSFITGAIAVMRAIESKRAGSPQWRSLIAYGSANLILVVIVLIGGLVLNHPFLAIDVYACTLIYSSILRIRSSFKESAIIYIK